MIADDPRTGIKGSCDADIQGSKVRGGEAVESNTGIYAVTKYNEMMMKARDLAVERMTKQAESMGADAIVCVRFSSAEVMQGAAEVMASGTAVKFK